MKKKLKFFDVTHSPFGFGTIGGKPFGFGLKESRVVASTKKEAIKLVKEKFNDMFVSVKEITNKAEITELKNKIKEMNKLKKVV